MRETRGLTVLHRLYPKAHFQTIGGCVNGGVLDVNACQDGVESWIELKQYDRPKTSRGLIRPPIMRGQPAWSALRMQAGGRCFVGLMLSSEFYLLPGTVLKSLSSGMSIQDLDDARLDNSCLFKEPIKYRRL